METIFMVGEQRSGSNLLRLILNASGEIAGPHPPHILQRFMPLMDIYGDLTDEAQFSKLIDDVCRLVEYNPVPWENVVLDREQIRQRCRENNLVAVFGAVMDVYAEAQSANAWICKSMQNIRWADQIDAYFPNPKYVYLYRDPRDVTLSFMKAVIGDKHPYFIAQQWAELQRLCLAELDKIGKDHFFSVCYEDLTSRPREVVADLSQFLGIDFKEEMLAFHQSNEAQNAASSSSLWQNVVQPIISSNSKKFMKEMSEHDIRIVESIAGDVMDRLGYERVYVQPGEETRFNKTDISRFHDINQEQIKAMSHKTDPEDLKRRQKQASIIEEIRSLAS
jgi:LPS sulfotransferase NodH